MVGPAPPGDLRPVSVGGREAAFSNGFQRCSRSQSRDSFCFLQSMRVPMTKSFREPQVRVPNFGIEGARPQRRPEWVDRNWRIVPPVSPPWSPPSLPPQDGTDPFGDPPRMPTPLRPGPERERGPDGSELLDWLPGAHRAGPGPNRKLGPTLPSLDEPLLDLVDRGPWRFIQPDRDVMRYLPFDSRQLEALRQLRPQEVMTLTKGPPSNGRAIQPPIFFPFD